MHRHLTGKVKAWHESVSMHSSSAIEQGTINERKIHGFARGRMRVVLYIVT